MRVSGFPVYRIGDEEISLKVVDGPFGSQLKVNEYKEKGVPLIRVSNCRTGEILIDDNPRQHRETRAARRIARHTKEANRSSC
jgi:hypothetical protein